MEKYDPIRVLGEGSFGKVYLMRDKVRRKFVCVKVIKIKNIPKKEREATKIEVDLLRRLNHPNIVRYIDSFLSKNNESLCIAMEYCDGGDLASQIKAARKKLFSEDKVLHWFVQIALGLHYMHSNKVLHRDLKTQNIFLLGNGRLVLGDLGISKVLEGTMDFAQTCIGTPYYMSPEIFKNKPYSYKSDVWALGCVLYEMTTLNHAFDANSLNGLAQKIIKGKYPALHHKYSRHLRDLIGQMLLTEPKQRPDLDQILRKPFIKKHIVTFFADIASRPSASIGEGTMIVRAAAGGPVGAFGNDANMISFRQQLESLGMTQAINEALNPVEAAPPSDPLEAKKLAREQANALKREEEHRRMVEAALEKLRLEREGRAQQRQAGGGVGGRGMPAGRDYRPHNAPGLRKEEPPMKSAAQRQPVRGGGIAFHAQQAKDVGARKESRRIAEQREREREAREMREKEARDRERRRQEQQEALERYEEKKREEARQLEEARQREEALAKQRRDQQRAQAEAVARREAQRDRERERQMAEIDQLKKDKLELDRRARERERLREERRNEEKRRLEEKRQENLAVVQDKVGAVQDQMRRLEVQKAEEKLSARDRVLLRKQEKQAKEEADRIEALRAAEADNRRLRQQAHYNEMNQFHHGDVPRKSPVDDDAKVGGMELDELTTRLHQARGEPRYGQAAINALSVDADDSDEASENASDVWENDGADNDEEVDEDMHRREEELQAELNLATRRCEELKNTLQVTKSFIEGRAGASMMGASRLPGGVAQRTKIVNDVIASDSEELSEEEEEDEAEESYAFDADEDLYADESDEEPVQKAGKPPLPKHDPNETPRSRPPPIAVKQSPYKNLQDAPSPSGRLGDRITRLRTRCIQALGRDAFQKAYDFLVASNEDGFDAHEQYEEDLEEVKLHKIREILGEDKAHFMPLIDQLIFMEETHAG